MRYDLTSVLKEKEERPTIQLTNNLIINVKNDMFTLLKIAALEKLEMNEVDKVEKIFELALSKEDYDKVKNLFSQRNLTDEQGAELIITIMAAMRNMDVEELRKMQDDNTPSQV